MQELFPRHRLPIISPFAFRFPPQGFTVSLTNNDTTRAILHQRNDGQAHYWISNVPYCFQVSKIEYRIFPERFFHAGEIASCFQQRALQCPSPQLCIATPLFQDENLSPPHFIIKIALGERAGRKPSSSQDILIAAALSFSRNNRKEREERKRSKGRPGSPAPPPHIWVMRSALL